MCVDICVFAEHSRDLDSHSFVNSYEEFFFLTLSEL